MLENKKQIEEILMALSEQLEDLNADPIEMLVCGGTALNVLGYVQRTTEDVDIVAYIEKGKDGETRITKAEGLKPDLKEAAERVQKDFNLTDNWLNTGPASVMDFGLPEGYRDRVKIHSYGEKLKIYFLERYDQIHFKLYAAVDRGGKHFDDLMALKPTEDEIEQAARWSMTHDISEPYKGVLKDLLKQIGFENVADKL